MNKKLDIRKVKDCWGGCSYVGYKEGKAYTECCDTKGEIINKYNIFENIEIISTKEYNNIHCDYKGVYSDFQNTSPNLKGLRTKLGLIDNATTLLFEGIHFIIVD